MILVLGLVLLCFFFQFVILIFYDQEVKVRMFINYHDLRHSASQFVRGKSFLIQCFEFLGQSCDFLIM